MKKLFILSVILLSANCVFAAANYTLQQNPESQNYQLPTTLKGRVVTVPAGETFKAVVTSPVSSETAVTGQTVTLALGSDLYYNGNKIAPAGSSVHGTVIENLKSETRKFKRQINFKVYPNNYTDGTNHTDFSSHKNRR